MTTKTRVKFHPYKVKRLDKAARLEKIIKDIKGSSSLKARVRNVSGRSIRVESVSWRKDIQCWLLDFVLFRDGHGPGKASFTNPIQGHSYKAGEYPAEDTAALFHPKTSHLIVQYNHQGVRVGSAIQYLMSYRADQTNAYDVEVLYDQSAIDRFNNRAGSKLLTVKVAPQELKASDWDGDTPIGSGVRSGQKAGAKEVTISMTMGRQKKFLGSVVETQLNRLKRLIGNGKTDGILSVKVGVAASLDAAMETIDLMSERLEFARELELGPDRRIPRSERWNCLIAAFNKWKSQLK